MVHADVRSSNLLARPKKTLVMIAPGTESPRLGSWRPIAGIQKIGITIRQTQPLRLTGRSYTDPFALEMEKTIL